jgi:hypothetical protein
LQEDPSNLPSEGGNKKKWWVYWWLYQELIKQTRHGKHGYGACGGAALSALVRVMNRQPFFIILQDATVQLCCVFFSKLGQLIP